MSNIPTCSKYTTKSIESTIIASKRSIGERTFINHLYKRNKLHLDHLELKEEKIFISLSSSSPSGVCPYCGKRSHRIHSSYYRILTDLSILGKVVILRFHARKFLCKNIQCSHTTFAEQPGDEIFKYGRRTRRCESMIGKIGINNSASVGERVLKDMGIGVSSSTVLRSVYKLEIPDAGEITELGVDDWAYRKGITYGSILVDMRTNRVIDLLTDRETVTFESWLRKHPEIRLISRDRSTNYSFAVSNVNKEIKEVADRFHLIKNFSDCIKVIIGANYSDIRTALQGEEPEVSVKTDMEQNTISKIENKKVDVRENMFREVKELQRKGFCINAIANKIHIARQTSRKYMKLEKLPPRRKISARNEYYKVDEYVEKEYDKGRTLKGIYREIREKEFKGALSPFYYHYRYLKRPAPSKKKKKKKEKKPKPSDNRLPLMPVNAVAAMMFKKIKGYELETLSTDILEKCIKKIKWFKTIYESAETFYHTIMGNEVQKLTLWLNEYRHTNIPKLKAFITGIFMDLKAVQNAIVYQTSNGVVEGYVNKLKTIKRMMYGRAGLELLKRKLVLSNKETFN